MTQRPTTFGLRHIALFAKNLAECVNFYENIIGMKLVWNPDPDNFYFSSGSDNLALHRAPADFNPSNHQHLDHLGFFLAKKEDVDTWFEFLKVNNVTIKAAPKDHRDGTRSCYCADPDGNVVQLIWVPDINS
jgi:catechol 2,3-dioxygenase-like lactoylglutathione lyase family enzyme